MTAPLFDTCPTEPVTYAAHVNICTGELFDLADLPPLVGDDYAPKAPKPRPGPRPRL